MMLKEAQSYLLESSNPSVVNVGSIAGVTGIGSSIAYASSKGALLNMTKSLARALGPIRVNAICPGTVKGDRMGRVIRDKAKFLKISKKAVESEFVSMTSLNTWVYEKDIGKMLSLIHI